MGYHGSVDRRLILGICLAGACHAELGISPDGQPAKDARGDGSALMIDAPSIDAPLGPWGTPAAVTNAADPTIDQDDCTLSSTQLELFFAIPDTTISGDPKDLYVLTRATTSDPWGAKTKLTTLDTSATEESPRLSLDDLTLYFGRNGDIYQSKRSAVGQPWGTPTAVTEVNSAAYEKWLAVCQNGYYMVSRDAGATGQDLYVGQLGGATPAPATELNSADSEISSFLSTDCKTTYFASNRSGQTQLYTATRPDPTSPFTTPTLVTDFGTATDNEDPWESADQKTFVFATIRGTDTHKAVYLSTR